MSVTNIIEEAAALFSKIPCVCGVVLGGSRATGTATDASDIDIGIYYDRETLDYDAINRVAQALDDEHRENLVCQEGGWGKWVNFGGWLLCGGIHTDLIFRDIARVKNSVEESSQGVFSIHYQTGHPHAYISTMYTGELASSQILYARDDDFSELKKRAEKYSDSLQRELILCFLSEAKFSGMFAQSYAGKGDPYYLAGHLFRAVSALNQVFFALNRQYCLNEKKAVARICSMPLHPENYNKVVEQIFACMGTKPEESAKLLSMLCEQAEDLCKKVL